MKIPQSLYNFKGSSDVSIIIGENGSGKSTLLNDIARHYSYDKTLEVVAIANSIHDKFSIRSKNFNALRGRQGRKQAKIAIKNAIKNIAEKDMQRLKFASMALEYVGFDPRIGFKVPKLKTKDIHGMIDRSYDLPESEKGEILYESSHLSESDRKDIFYLCERIERLQGKEKIWLSMDKYSFESIRDYSLTELFVLERKLINLKIIDPIEVYLSKDDNEISLLEASSGELSLITSIVYLSTIIEHNTVILIDEPENSLHPKWQKEYVKNLLDIFYLYEPKIIIATHSPTILNGAEVDIQDIDIYLSKDFEITKKRKDSQNIEESYYNFFGIITPENRFLSNLITEKINDLAEKEITRDQFNEFITALEETIYDKRQEKLIEAVVKIANKIRITGS